MSRRRYSDEFKIEAVKQVLENGYTITDTAERLEVHPTSLSSWIKRFELSSFSGTFQIALLKILQHT
ncbi:transposase [Sulfurimonas sp.]